VLGHPALVGERAPKQHLDLGVEAAQVVSGPARESVVNRRVDPQRDLLSLAAHV
jgi:hypothetical protein